MKQGKLFCRKPKKESEYTENTHQVLLQDLRISGQKDKKTKTHPSKTSYLKRKAIWEHQFKKGI